MAKAAGGAKTARTVQKRRKKTVPSIIASMLKPACIARNKRHRLSTFVCNSIDIVLCNSLLSIGALVQRFTVPRLNFYREHSVSRPACETQLNRIVRHLPSQTTVSSVAVLTISVGKFSPKTIDDAVLWYEHWAWAHWASIWERERERVASIGHHLTLFGPNTFQSPPWACVWLCN